MAKQVKHEYSANMRRALYEALVKEAKEEGLTLTEYCMRWWREDWKAAANVMVKFMPREVEGKVDHNHNHDHHHTHANVSDTQEFIDSVLQAGLQQEREQKTKH